MSALEVFGSFHKAAELAKEANSGCSVSTTERHIALSPKYIGRLRTGVSEILDGELGRFSESLCGVLLAYGNVRLLQSSGTILDDDPFIHFDVKLDAVVFRPKVGSLLKCVVNEQASDHVGCLVHDWFNVSLLGSKKDLNGQRQLKLAPGYVVLVQVERLRTMNGMLAIEARAPDNGAELILEAVKLQSSDTDSESNVESTLQPSVSDTPDGQSTVTAGEEVSRPTEKVKKRKHPKVKEEVDVDSHQQLSCLDISGGVSHTSEATSDRKKSKKHRQTESTVETYDSHTQNGSTDETTGTETSHESKRKKKKHKHSKVVALNLDSTIHDSDSIVVEATTGEEASQKKKKKKKSKDTRTDVDSEQPSVILNDPCAMKIEKEEDSLKKKTKRRQSAAEVVSDNQPPFNEVSPAGREFTKLKKRKHRDKENNTTPDSDHQKLSDLPSSTTEVTGHKKVKKHPKGVKQERDATSSDYVTTDTNLEDKSHTASLVVKLEPGMETGSISSQSALNPGSDTESSKKSHKKHKRKKQNPGEVDDPDVNGSSKRKIKMEV